MSETWSQFYSHIQPHVPGCPEVVINDHLQIAAENFCKRSAVWRDTFTFSTEVGVSDYSPPKPGSSRIEDVLMLHCESVPLPRTTDAYYSEPASWPQGRPTRYALFGDETLRLYATPDDAYTVEGTLVLMPSANASRVPDFLYEDHLQSITYGAIATLTAIPGKEWTNPDLAAYYGPKFWKCADDAKGRDLRKTNLSVSMMPLA